MPRWRLSASVRLEVWLASQRVKVERNPVPPLHPPPNSCLLLTCVLPLSPSARPQDVAELESRLGRKLEKAERARIGVGQLRRFLEHLLQRRYLEVRGRRGTVAAGVLGRLNLLGGRHEVNGPGAQASARHIHTPRAPLSVLQNVPTIVPVLEKEYRNASRRLEETQVELNDLHPEKLKVGVGWAGLLHSGREGDGRVSGMATAWQRRHVG